VWREPLSPWLISIRGRVQAVGTTPSPRCPIREDTGLHSRVCTLCPAAFIIEEVQDAHDKEDVHVSGSGTSVPAIVSVDSVLQQHGGANVSTITVQMLDGGGKLQLVTSISLGT